MLTLYNNRNTLIFSAELAEEIGLQESLILRQLDHWIATQYKRTIQHNGDIWIRISVPEMREGGLGFIPQSTLYDTLRKMIKNNLIKETKELNDHPFDSTKWYTLDRDGINKLKSAFFSQPTPTNGTESKTPDNFYYDDRNSNYETHNPIYSNDSLKEKDSNTQDSKQKNIKEPKDTKDDHLTPPDQIDGFSTTAEIGKTLLTPPPEHTRPTSLEERQVFRDKLAYIMGLSINIQENKSLVNRMVDVLYPQYRLNDLLEMQFYWTSIDWRHKKGTTHPTKSVVFEIIEKAVQWSRAGYPMPEAKQANDYQHLIET